MNDTGGLRALIRTGFWVVMLVLSMMLNGADTAEAALVDDQDVHANDLVLSRGVDRFRVSIGPLPIPPSVLAGKQLAVAKKQFPNWTFLAHPVPLPGNIIVEKYDAAVWTAANYPAVGTNPQAAVTIVYDSGWLTPLPGDVFTKLIANPPTAQLNWVQVVTTDRPRPGDPETKVDVHPAAPNRPLYWPNVDLLAPDHGDYSIQQNAFGEVRVRLKFIDRPTRPPAAAPLTWSATLAIAEWDFAEPGTVTLHDGLVWGFSATCLPKGPDAGSDHRFGVWGDHWADSDTTGPTAPVPCPPVGSGEAPPTPAMSIGTLLMLGIAVCVLGARRLQTSKTG